MSDEFKTREYLTTTEAAKLLCVSPDTVLKWVKAGKVKSRRTLGGHFRIPSTELSLFTSQQSLDVEDNHSPLASQTHQYCWEFLAAGGPTKTECEDCITYRSTRPRKELSYGQPEPAAK